MVEQLLNELDKCTTPEDLAALVKEYINDPSRVVSPVSEGILTEYKYSVRRLGRLLPLLQTLSRLLGVTIIRRKLFSRIRYSLSILYDKSCLSCVHFLRVIDVVNNPDEWMYLYKVLDRDGKDALMRWLKATFALHLVEPYVVMERWARIKPSDYIKFVQEDARKIRIGKVKKGGKVFDVFRVEGEKRVYNIATTTHMLVPSWFAEIYPRPPRDARVLVDIGAFAGESSIWMYDRVNGEAKVLAFEPDPSVLEALRYNIEINKLENNVVPLGYALSDKTGKMILSAQEGMSSITFSTSERKHEVSVVTLDSILEKLSIKTVEYVKIDVEGAEVNVLRGAKRTLREYRPVMAVSVYHRPRDPIVIARMLQEAGYTKFSMRFILPLQNEVVLVAM
ncbi:methyltransferase FkbM family [Pyrolobus fumarii 1A]|uniref:Methyltransferase FkbM family n=1 Tax=Pyrolobus fumarii (strain DSM 11204 / 1A) TaxID=694429 RepID=G0EG24_PYRF1|nr:FkbM family methyltransferase [Pyrolobus fumarii]AEM38272.1 methyltransferase FkbM family [Pyrolobus fumarii 1A]